VCAPGTVADAHMHEFIGLNHKGIVSPPVCLVDTVTKAKGHNV
jgi:hypothetical protein